jgi:hypothetical protein
MQMWITPPPPSSKKKDPREIIGILKMSGSGRPTYAVFRVSDIFSTY